MKRISTRVIENTYLQPVIPRSSLIIDPHPQYLQENKLMKRRSSRILDSNPNVNPKLTPKNRCNRQERTPKGERGDRASRTPRKSRNSRSPDANQNKITSYFAKKSLSESPNNNNNQQSRTGPNEQPSAFLHHQEQVQPPPQQLTPEQQQLKQEVINRLVAQEIKSKEYQRYQQHLTQSTKRTLIKLLPQLREVEKRQRENYRTEAGTLKFQNDRFIFIEKDIMKKVKEELNAYEKRELNEQRQRSSKRSRESLIETTKSQTKSIYSQVEYEEMRIRYLTLCMEREKLMKFRKLIHQEEECILSRREWRVNENLYPFLLIGKGGFSEVYKCFDIQRMAFVAIKLSYANSPSPEYQRKYMKYMQREFENQCGLHHENIAEVYERVDLKDQFIFAATMELCSGPELGEYLSYYHCVREDTAKDIIRQILRGLEYMHDNGVIHYDLKPRNIIFHEGVIKIVDFGLSKQMETGESQMKLTTFGVGTFYYLPPESSITNASISPKVDIFSLGVIFYELLYGSRPFGNKKKQVEAAQIIQDPETCKVVFPKQSRYPVSIEAHAFIRKCLSFDAKDRYSAREALSSPYLQQPKQ